LGVQVEVTRREVRQSVRPEPGRNCRQVQVVAILTGQLKKRPVARAGSIEQSAEFLGGQFPPTTANIHGHIQQRERFERVGADPLRLYQPAGEPTQRDRVRIDSPR
jgi:hypothetical protein